MVYETIWYLTKDEGTRKMIYETIWYKNFKNPWTALIAQEIQRTQNVTFN